LTFFPHLIHKLACVKENKLELEKLERSED